MAEEHKFGWADGEEDWGFLEINTMATFKRPPPGFVPPEKMSFRDILERDDQLRLNSCTGHGGSSSTETCEFLSSGQKVQLSRMFAYLNAQRISGIRGDNGATIAGLVQGLTNTGICLESEFPYTGRYQAPSTITQSQIASANKRKILGHETLGSYQEVFDWISQGKGPVVIGFQVTQSYENLKGKNSVVTLKILKERGIGGHCVLLAGYSGAKDPAGFVMPDQLGSWLNWGDDWWSPWTRDAVEFMCQREGGNNQGVWGLSDITGFDQARIDRVVSWDQVM